MTELKHVGKIRRPNKSMKLWTANDDGVIEEVPVTDKIEMSGKMPYVWAINKKNAHKKLTRIIENALKNAETHTTSD